MKFKVIISMVKSELTDRIIDEAKEAGATGATVINARGVGIHEAKTFFGLTLEAQSDVVLFLVEAHLVDKILEAIYRAGRFQDPGTGIALALSVDRAIGLESQLEKMKADAQRLEGQKRDG